MNGDDIKLIELLSHSKTLSIIKTLNDKPKNSIGSVGNGFQVFITMEEDFDFEGLKCAFNKRMEDISSEKRGIERKLSNEGFVKNAPAEVVKKEKERLEELEKQFEVITSYSNELNNMKC